MDGKLASPAFLGFANRLDRLRGSSGPSERTDRANMSHKPSEVDSKRGTEPGSENGNRGNKNTIALNAFSRVMAVLLLMLLVGVGGSYLDKWLGTSYLTVIGFLVGGAIAIVGMMYVVRAAEFERKEQKQS